MLWLWGKEDAWFLPDDEELAKPVASILARQVEQLSVHDGVSFRFVDSGPQDLKTTTAARLKEALELPECAAAHLRLYDPRSKAYERAGARWECRGQLSHEEYLHKLAAESEKEVFHPIAMENLKEVEQSFIKVNRPITATDWRNWRAEIAARSKLPAIRRRRALFWCTVSSMDLSSPVCTTRTA